MVALARRIGYWPAAIVIIAVGSALRFVHWAGSGSFSQDEISLVISFAHRSLGGLRGGLEYDQVAPMGWLWAEKLAYEIAGPGELSLRFIPMLAGCASLVVVAFLARRLLSPLVALLALGLVSFSPQILYYSTQVKQYSFEVGCTALLVLLALRALPDPTARPEVEQGRGRVVAFWATAAVTCWFATTSIFTAGVVGGLLLLFAAWRARWRRVLWHVAGGAAAAASIGAMYLVQQPHVAGWLTTWWARHYPGSMGPVDLTPSSLLYWTVRCGNALARQALGVRNSEGRVILLVLLVAGLVALVVRHRRVGVLVAAPVVTAYLLALLRLYPFGARLALWVVPLMIIMVCAAVDAAVRALARPDHPRMRWAAGALALVMVSSLAWTYAPTLGRRLPHNQLTLYERAEEAIRYVAANRGPADLVYFGYNTSRVAVWYGPRAGLEWDGLFQPVRGRPCARAKGGVVTGPPVFGVESTGAATGARLMRGRVTNELLTSAPRVWIVIRASERVNPGRLREYHAIMGRSAVLVQERRFNWILVSEYRFTGRPDPSAPSPRKRVVEAECYRFSGR
ncbi:glycosyltransferase family 39 protein [Luedemannella helvata]|uniref:Glycosyltransferase RgtA/B/C/D-like domain-containing protein n=1 Tax=Luedemannella helvata TaxID=349315 RepID=A0ABP4X2C5_9ACTN